MLELIQVRKKAQLTLPLSVRRELGIKEGDFLDVRVQDGSIVLKARKLVDQEQAWFWTKRWQEGEREAEDDIRAGRVHRLETTEDAVSFLHKRAEKATRPIRKSKAGKSVR